MLFLFSFEEMLTTLSRAQQLIIPGLGFERLPLRERLVPLSVKKKTPPEKKTLGSINLKKPESEVGEEFLPLDCMLRIP